MLGQAGSWFRGRGNVTVRVRFAQPALSHSLGNARRTNFRHRDTTELAEELVRALLADHPHEKTISLLAISVSNIEEHQDVELKIPLGLTDEARRPGIKKGMARWSAGPCRR